MNLCHYGDFVLDPTGQLHECLRKESDCLQEESSYLVVYWTPSKLKSPLGEYLHWMQVSSHPLFIWWDLSTDFFPRCLFSPIFQSCYFQLTEHPVSTLRTANQSVTSCTVGHFCIQTNCMMVSTAWSSVHCKDFLSPESFRIFPERASYATAVHFWVLAK